MRIAPAALRCADLQFIHAEVMSHFVPDGIGNKLSAVFGIARQAFMRALENRDPVRHGKAFEDTALSEGPAFVETQKSAAGGDAPSRQLRFARLRFHHQRDVLHAPPEAGRDTRIGGLHQAIEFSRLHRTLSILRYFEGVDPLPLHSRTPEAWARAVLADPVPLLIDHAFLEKKAANNALELMTRWPSEWLDGWVETMTGVARDEAAHLAQVTRILMRRGARLERVHKNPYANALRLLVRKGDPAEILDRLLVSALIELRSCERFEALAEAAEDTELAAFYQALHTSELGHYRVFLKLARKFTERKALDERWQQLLSAEARILAGQEPGPRIHSGWPAEGGSTPPR